VNYVDFKMHGAMIKKNAGLKAKQVAKCVSKVRSFMYYKNYCTQINFKRIYTTND